MWKRLGDLKATDMVETASTGGYIPPTRSDVYESMKRFTDSLISPDASVTASAETIPAAKAVTVKIEITPERGANRTRKVTVREVESGVLLNEWKIVDQNSLTITLYGYTKVTP